MQAAPKATPAKAKDTPTLWPPPPTSAKKKQDRRRSAAAGAKGGGGRARALLGTPTISKNKEGAAVSGQKSDKTDQVPSPPKP